MWLARYCVDLEVQISRQVQYFVGLEVQVSSQVQYFVDLDAGFVAGAEICDLEVQISW